MDCVYVLYSKHLDKIYVGVTNSLIDRFSSHNFLATKGWTIRGRPWVVVHVEFVQDRTAGLKREKQLKGGQGRAWIRKEIMTQAHLVGLLSA